MVLFGWLLIHISSLHLAPSFGITNLDVRLQPMLRFCNLSTKFVENIRAGVSRHAIVRLEI